ncbi:DUF2786 domain-containing protein [Streptomyces sp. A1-5]|uniref:DUF2786 domain-containing protein n=1 Tax=Streptomyces sp. A1-5 TaxID=2738410 RepID=UPI001F2338EC|nr:DUF2786 domain-containing protein [Streptomyces sp. A1-5]UJB44884.1 DUF2786 domain-containing protein [Streptomyces sp. A1-5]
MVAPGGPSEPKDAPSISRRLQSLRALAEHPRTPRAERELAAALAAALMERYGLGAPERRDGTARDGIIVVRMEPDKTVEVLVLAPDAERATRQIAGIMGRDGGAPASWNVHRLNAQGLNPGIAVWRKAGALAQQRAVNFMASNITRRGGDLGGLGSIGGTTVVTGYDTATGALASTPLESLEHLLEMEAYRDAAAQLRAWRTERGITTRPTATRPRPTALRVLSVEEVVRLTPCAPWEARLQAEIWVEGDRLPHVRRPRVGVDRPPHPGHPHGARRRLLTGTGVPARRPPRQRRYAPGAAPPARETRRDRMTAHVPPAGADTTADLASGALARARAAGDRRAEARALCDLGAALTRAGRASEGRYLCRRAAGLAAEVGDRPAEEAAFGALGHNLAELDALGERWRAVLLEGGDETGFFASPAAARSDASYATGGRPDDAPARLTGVPVVELACGFVAVKFLGPFVESFAGKLGERLGESTVTATGRLRLLWHRRSGRRDLDVLTPGERTTLVLPDDFDDAARLAAIDLDLGADGVRGAELHWDADAGTWSPVNT